MKLSALIVAITATTFLAASALATPSLGLTTNFAGTADGFTGTGGVSTVSWTGTQGGYVQISFPASGSSQEGMATNSGTEYTGSYAQHSLSVSFSFYASNALPDSSALWFGSGGDIWRLAFDQAALGWESHRIYFTYDQGWSSELGGDETAFMNALSSVDWVGIHVVDNAGDFSPQVYGIDNWGYAVPEPSDYALAIVFLSGIWVLYRRRETGSTDPAGQQMLPA